MTTVRATARACGGPDDFERAAETDSAERRQPAAERLRERPLRADPAASPDTQAGSGETVREVKVGDPAVEHGRVSGRDAGVGVPVDPCRHRRVGALSAGGLG